ncbi:dipeptidyl aminopeptidase [Ralstonia pickettii]|uniref:dienelactone hydrolase family protein n=1 Tax=Ralstonia pickettii TaxID=329 RepID=UPI0027155B86|nr:dipeptidyl aminopeptidase [Ralstonia pickettii]WKZ88089.1 dipeptidyl aminopeptidase [Ralstonia pickettii]
MSATHVPGKLSPNPDQVPSQKAKARKRPIVSKVILVAGLLVTVFAHGLFFSVQTEAAEAPAQSTAPITAPIEPEIVSITVPGAGMFGGDVDMRAEVYKPAGVGPFPTLIFSHGRSADRLDRANLKYPIPKGHVRYWLAKGIAVVAPIRVGYGATGGPDQEASGALFNATGVCTSKPDFPHLVKVTRDITMTALAWTRMQPWVDKDRILLEGQSAGGFATIATVAAQPPGVIGYINFAGGAAGWPDGAPGHSCDQEQLREVIGELGKTTKIPGLWLYAKNDQYWGPDAPGNWYRAFAAGGSPTEFIHAAELPGRDGHLLMYYGGKLWSVHVDRFVKALGL